MVRNRNAILFMGLFLAAISSLSGHPLKQRSLLSVHYCGYWIPLISSALGSTHAFHPIQHHHRIAATITSLVRPFHSTSRLFLESREDLEQLRIEDLKDRLKEHGLKVGGRREELIDRLLLSESLPETAMPRRRARAGRSLFKLYDDSDKETPLRIATEQVAPAKTEDKNEKPEEEEVAVEEGQEKSQKRARKTKTDEDDSAKKNPKEKKKQPEQRITEVDDIPRLWNEKKAKENGSYSKYWLQ